MIRERGRREITGRRELIQKDPQVQELIHVLSESARGKVINAIPNHDIPEDIRDAVRTSVRAVRAYMHHLKIPVRLSEKDILKRCRFVADSVATFRDPGGHTFEIKPLPAALYDTFTELFVIHTPNTHRTDRFNLIRILMHEIMHSISHNETRIVRHPTGSIRMIHTSGYKNARSEHGERREVIEERFIGFNEAITDLMALRAISHAQALPAGYVQLSHANDGYTDEKNLVHIICETIGGRIGKSTEEMERMFFKGYIDGSRMNLRIIAEHFGPQALSVLSKLGQHRDAPYHGSVLNSKITSWFTHALDAQRDELYHEIMSYPTPQQLAREELEKKAYYDAPRPDSSEE
jgi:hypothetical protein